MKDPTQPHFRSHSSAKPWWKKPIAVGPTLLLFAIVGAVVYLAKVDEAKLVERAKAKDGSSAYALYVLGFRRIQQETTWRGVADLLDNSATPADVRVAAAYALGSVKSSAVLPFLAEGCLRDPDTRVRAMACHSIGKTGELGAADPLIRALEDTDSFVRKAAAEGAGTLKDHRAVDKLIDCLIDPASDVRHAAHDALVVITEQDFAMDAGAWKRWRESGSR